MKYWSCDYFKSKPDGSKSIVVSYIAGMAPELVQKDLADEHGLLQEHFKNFPTDALSFADGQSLRAQNALVQQAATTLLQVDKPVEERTNGDYLELHTRTDINPPNREPQWVRGVPFWRETSAERMQRG